MRMFPWVFLLLAGAASAQDRITVPLSNPSMPATLRVNLMNASVTVLGGSSGGPITIEQEPGRGRSLPEPPAPPGMHRIDGGRNGLNVSEERNIVTVTGQQAQGNVLVRTPSNTSLQLKTLNGGHIEVTGLNGALEISNVNGSITLRNISGSVIAHSTNGSITAMLDQVAPDKPMSFTSQNGKVEVTLPADARARLRMRTRNGEVHSDFDVKLDLDQNGSRRITEARDIYGSINGGGPEYRLETMNGNVLLHKK